MSRLGNINSDILPVKIARYVRHPDTPDCLNMHSAVLAAYLRAKWSKTLAPAKKSQLLAPCDASTCAPTKLMAWPISSSLPEIAISTSSHTVFESARNLSANARTDARCTSVHAT